MTTGARRATTALAAVLSFVAFGACIEGPFERANPHDPDSPFTMTIVGGVDTMRVIGATALFQLVTDPVTVGYTPLWTSLAPNHLESLGYGRYQVKAIPPAPLSVTIRARLGGNVADRVVVLTP